MARSGRFVRSCPFSIVHCRASSAVDRIDDHLVLLSVAGDGIGEKPIVSGVGTLHGSLVVTPEPGAALNVSEEKGNGPVGQVDHTRFLSPVSLTHLASSADAQRTPATNRAAPADGAARLGGDEWWWKWGRGPGRRVAPNAGSAQPRSMTPA